MASSASPSRSIPAVPLLAGLAGLVAVVFLAILLARPAQHPSSPIASNEARAYLPHLALSNVSMQASENFMKQEVLEVKGNITDSGPRALRSVSVFCLFYGVDGREIYRERVPIIPSGSPPLHSGETRSFRLPFDSIPDGWNQALPKMVIAQITFAQ